MKLAEAFYFALFFIFPGVCYHEGQQYQDGEKFIRTAMCGK